MSTIIKDGAGSGFSARVDHKNRLQIAGETNPAFETASQEGRGYFINTGVATLTNDSESCLVYFQNLDDDRELFVESVRISLSGSTGGTGSVLLQNYINPTGGTIITGTNGVDFFEVPPVNNNLAELNSQPFNGISRIGLNGTTVSGPNLPLPDLAETASSVMPLVNVALPKGTATAVTITPPAGNTLMQVVIAISLYYLNGAN